MQRFSNKVALVTGGNSGVGKATAEAFAREGAKVVLAARRAELGHQVAESIRAGGGEATFLRCDITDEAQIRALIDQIMERYGRLDCAYNNAWSNPEVVALTSLTAKQFDDHFAFLRGTFLCIKYEILAMSAGFGGAIVNCSSLGTRVAKRGLGAYAAAKAGLESLTRTAARECADKKIRVNSICMGPFETSMAAGQSQVNSAEWHQAFVERIALKRYGHPEELAQTVLFLCSEGASYITGTSLGVDGGYFLT